MKGKSYCTLYRVLALLLLSATLHSADALALDVSGTIDEDTTWTMADSPIQVTGDVLVSETTTLTIEPGVEVIFQSLENASRGFLIDIEGTLDAQGSSDQPIVFTAQDRRIPWSAIQFRDISEDWNATTSTGSILSHCIIEYGDAMIVTQNAMPRIANNAIRFGATAGIVAYYSDAAVSASGNSKIVSNQIYNNPTGLLLSAEGGTILENYFLNNQLAVGISFQSNDVEFRNNTIAGAPGTDFAIGVYLELNEPAAEGITANIQIEENRIQSGVANSNLLVITEVEGSLYNLSITDNNLSFAEEEGYAVFLGSWPEEASDLDLPNNWWGTNDTAIINRLIYDESDDFRLPAVTYTPYLDEPLADAGSGIGYPIVADAGADLETAFDRSVSLDGSASFDPEAIGIYLWEQIDGPPVTLMNADNAVASFIAPSGGTEGQELRFALTVTAKGSFPSTDEVLVTVSPDAPVSYVEVGGGCFIKASQSQAIGKINMIAVGIVGFLMVLCWIGLSNKQTVSVLFVVFSLCVAFPAEAGFFAVGGGGGGEAEQYNISMETGAKDITAGNTDLMFAFGFPFIPHGDTNLPENTIAATCPNDECIPVDEVRKGTEVGMYGKLGIEIGSTNLYLNAIGGFTVFTESQLVQSPGSGFIYEQSSDTTLEPLYGAGLSYFPEDWEWPILLQVDFDIIRGVTGTIGWYW